MSDTVWDENVVEPVVKPIEKVALPFDYDSLDDGRCKVSSWRGPKAQKRTYENVFGPGGFNRCIGKADHANLLHKDEWGNVFQADPFRVIRKENPSPLLAAVDSYDEIVEP